MVTITKPMNRFERARMLAEACRVLARKLEQTPEDLMLYPLRLFKPLVGPETRKPACIGGWILDVAGLRSYHTGLGFGSALEACLQVDLDDDPRPIIVRINQLQTILIEANDAEVIADPSPGLRSACIPLKLETKAILIEPLRHLANALDWFGFNKGGGS